MTEPGQTETGEPLEPGHQLTSEVRALGSAGPWRIVATCSCLGFARRADCASRPVAEYGRLMAADFHAMHVARVRRGLDVPEERPSWLPEIGDAA